MLTKALLGDKLMFPTEYLTSVELLNRDWTLTISTISQEDVRMADGKKKRCPVLSFWKTNKKLILNKTNAGTIADMHGKRAEDWTGKQITIYPTRVKFGRDMVDAIRIRDRRPALSTAAPDFDEPEPRPVPEEDVFSLDDLDASDNREPEPPGDDDQRTDGDESQAPLPTKLTDEARKDDAWINKAIVQFKPRNITDAQAKRHFHAKDTASWPNLAPERQQAKYEALMDGSIWK